MVSGKSQDLTKETHIHSRSEVYNILESLPDAVLILTLDGTIIFSNRGFVEITGFSKHEIENKKYEVFVTDSDKNFNKYENVLKKTAVEGSFGPFEFPFKPKVGLSRFGEAHLSLITFDDGNKNIIALIHDITERLDIEKKLKEMALLPIQDANPILRISKNGQILFSNQAAQVFLDYWEVTPENLLPETFQHEMYRIWKNKKNAEKELRIADRIYKVEVKPILGEDYLNIYGQDITEEFLANKELQEREQRLKNAEKIANLGHWEWDIPNDHIIWSEGVYRIFRLKPDEFVPTFDSYTNYVHPEDVEKLHEKIAMAISQKCSYSNLHRGITKDGRIILVEGKGDVILSEDGELIKMIGTVQDVTELKKTEEQIKAAERIAKLGNWEWDLSSDILIASDEAYNISDLKPGELSSRDYSSLIHPDDRNHVNDSIRLAIAQKRPLKTIYRLVTPTGKIKHIRLLGEVVLSNHEPVKVIGTVQDITDQIKAEEKIRNLNIKLEKKVEERTKELAEALSELEKKEKRHQAVLNDLTEMVFRWKPDGSFTFMNEKMKSHYSDSNDQKTISDANPFTRKQMKEIIQALSVNSPVITNEYCLIKEDGQCLWEEWTDRGIFNEKDELIEIQSVGKDITEAKKASEMHRKLSSAVYYSPASVMITNIDGIIEYVNPSFEKITGYSASEVIGKKPSIQKSGVQPDNFYKDMWETIKAGNVWHSEFSNLRKNGELYIEFESIAPIKNDEGEITHFIAVKEDVTKQRKAEEALIESERRLNDILNHAPLMVYMYDPNGRYTYVNDEFVRIQQLSREDVLGKADFEFRSKKEAKKYYDTFKKASETKEIQYFENAIKQGTTIKHYTYLVFPLMNNKDEVYSVVGKALDITDRKNAEFAMQEARKVAEEANRAKSSFVANISHEIRTPLNAMIGLTYMVLQTELSSQQRDYVDKIQSAAENLLGIIKDILDFSKIEAGRMEIEAIPFNLNNIVGEIANIINVNAKEKGLNLEFDISEDIPVTLIGDPLRLKQVLLNLCGNAIKFTTEGEVVVTAEVLHKEDEKITLKFSVRDTGIGLTQAQIAKLFQAFTQADSSITRKYGGTGLGLMISKQLVELMGGEMGATSKPGVGSTFYFTAEFSEPTFGDNRKGMNTINPGDTRILVIEDDPSKNKALRLSLEIFGSSMTIVENGESGIKKLYEAVENEPYGMVIIDEKLSDMDGVEFIQQIRNDPDLIKIPIIIISSKSDYEKIAEQQRNMDMVGILIEPITSFSLSNAIMNALRVVDHTGNIEDGNKAIQDLNILRGFAALVVEDNEINQEVTQSLLEMVGASVDLASNGVEAIAAMKQKPYDFVLMDIQMPVMDGLEATRRIRAANATYSDTIIIALSAYATQEDAKKTLQVGMNDYVTKPINPIVLFATLSKWIDVAKPGKNLKASIPTGNAFPALPGIDTENGLQRFGGDRERYRVNLKRFSTKYAGTIDEIEHALEAQDVEIVKQLVHTLKGVAGNIGASHVQKSAEKLEEAIKKGNSAEQRNLLLAIRKQLHEVLLSIDLLDQKTSQATSLKNADSEKIIINARVKSKTSQEVPDSAKDDVKIDFPNEDIAPILRKLSDDLTNADSVALEVVKDIKTKFPDIGLLPDFIDLEKYTSQYDFEAALGQLIKLANSLHLKVTGEKNG
ncbi:MAG TPA: hypothetical protein DCK95_04440 [Anaerolineaceae bacterium]|nr:hypothetical protein [Anaerolineaceae bacterium]